MRRRTDLTAKDKFAVPESREPNEPVEIDRDGDDRPAIRRPPRDEAKIQAIIKELEAASKRFAHLRTGQSTDEIMREIRGDDPFPP